MQKRSLGDQSQLFAVVQEHVKNATVEATNENSRCIDGRYGHDPAYMGSMARPGGHFGYVMALLAASNAEGLAMSSEECFERVHAAVTNLGHRFSMHTDHATHPPDAEGCTHCASYVPIGCGHISKALDPTHARTYQVPVSEMEAALASAHDKNGSIAMTNLPGSHKEDALLIVMSTERTVLPQFGDHSFFVYDAWRDHIFMERLVAELAVPGIHAATFFEAANTQLNATMRLVAPETPVFNLDLSSNRPVIALAGVMR